MIKTNDKKKDGKAISLRSLIHIMIRVETLRLALGEENLETRLVLSKALHAAAECLVKKKYGDGLDAIIDGLAKVQNYSKPKSEVLQGHAADAEGNVMDAISKVVDSTKTMKRGGG